jgi:FAD-dependent oxidoreductase domain-containing protein 1
MQYDVVIVGGAVMGSATAYHLRRLAPDQRVLVVEKDPTYRYSSTLLSDGNVRIQFNLPENILMSQYAMQVIETFPDDFEVSGWRPEPDPRHQGNLFLADSATVAAAREGLERQLELGCSVSWLDAAEITERFPAFAGTAYVGGTLGPLDGSVDPSAVLHGYRRKAIALGAEYLEAEVGSLLAHGDRIAGVRLVDGTEISAPHVLDAAGAWCAGLASTVGVDLPVLPVMRSVYTVETHLNSELPSVFAPSGLYVLPERDGHFLVAWSQPDDPVGFDFTLARARFDDLIWPELVAWFPAFESLYVTGGWAGLYEVNTLDGNAILGEWPTLSGLWLANGFSGHGFQQCHAVGRHLAESILGLEPSLDLSRFGPQRILDADPYPEHPGRII